MNTRMNKKYGDGTMPLIISYILIVCGCGFFILLFFNNGYNALPKWIELLLGAISLFFGIGGYRNRPNS